MGTRTERTLQGSRMGLPTKLARRAELTRGEMFSAMGWWWRMVLLATRDLGITPFESYRHAPHDNGPSRTFYSA